MPKFPPTSLTLKHKLPPTKGNKKPIGANVKATEASPNLFQHRSARAQHTGIAVGDVDSAPERRPEQHAQHALASVLGDAVVIVHNTEEHQRVYHHLLDPRGPCPDARADHVHPRSSNAKPLLSPPLLSSTASPAALEAETAHLQYWLPGAQMQSTGTSDACARRWSLESRCRGSAKALRRRRREETGWYY
jgi:hypothetical protein